MIAMREAPAAIACRNPLCGATGVRFVLGYCRPCRDHVKRHHRERDPTETRGRVSYPAACRNMACAMVVSANLVGGLCQACYAYRETHGRALPDATAIARRDARREGPAARLCLNCGVHGAPGERWGSLGRCAACYQMLVKHGSDRPPEAKRKMKARRKEFHPCENQACGDRTMVTTNLRCISCAVYLRRHGFDAPPHVLARRRARRDHKPLKPGSKRTPQ